jgi:hypothetical protein
VWRFLNLMNFYLFLSIKNVISYINALKVKGQGESPLIDLYYILMSSVHVVTSIKC